MNRIIYAAVVLLAAVSVHGTDRFSGVSAQMSISTTGRITNIDAKARTMKIRASAIPASLNEYTLVTTGNTAFQDGADVIRFEDFQAGETISIRGCLNGNTLRASRVAKWD